MSTEVQKFHLSSECRYILYRLRAEIDFQLNKDITDGFPCETRCLGNLLPLIYQAFIKIWCGKVPLVVKKPFRSFIGLDDDRKILVDFASFQRICKDAAAYRAFIKDSNEDLPF